MADNPTRLDTEAHTPKGQGDAAPARAALTTELTPSFDVGDYWIEARIGVGGMGDVYRATHAFLKKPVAFKILKPEFMADDYAVERFRREILAIGQLDHVNIVRA